MAIPYDWELAEQVPDAVFARDDNIARHPDEQPVLNDAGAGFQLARQGGRTGDGTEVGVKDEVALVGLEGTAAVHAQPRRRAEGLQVSRLRFPAEGDDLHRYCPGCPEPLDQFGIIDDDDEALGRLGDDLLAQVGAAAAFDEIERGIDFIGAVDGDIDARAFGQCRQWDAEFDGGPLGGERGGYSADVGQFAAAERMGDAAGGENGGAAAAQAHDHARFDEAGGVFARLLFESVGFHAGHCTTCDAIFHYRGVEATHRAQRNECNIATEVVTSSSCVKQPR